MPLYFNSDSPFFKQDITSVISENFPGLSARSTLSLLIKDPHGKSLLFLGGLGLIQTALASWVHSLHNSHPHEDKNRGLAADTKPPEVLN